MKTLFLFLLMSAPVKSLIQAWSEGEPWPLLAARVVVLQFVFALIIAQFFFRPGVQREH